MEELFGLARRDLDLALTLIFVLILRGRCILSFTLRFGSWSILISAGRLRRFLPQGRQLHPERERQYNHQKQPCNPDKWQPHFIHEI